MTVPVELIPVTAAPAAFRKTIVWSPGDSSGGIETTLDPWLTSFGTPGAAAITVARVGIGAFIVDRAIKRNALRQRRQIELIVQVPDPDLGDQAAGSLQRLLGFVTGDDWAVAFEPDIADRPTSAPTWYGSEVALLSGGLDSYCGALIGGTTDRLFLSHSDASVIKHSQRNAAAHVPGFDRDRHVQVRLVAKKPFNREPSRRSRSILFMALAVALADAAGAASVEVPENGFTSLNPPLAANRGGVLTTRSTHPMTFALTEAVLADLGLDIELRNPYEWHTKGELVVAAVDHVGADRVRQGLPNTLSCAKSNLILKNSGFGRNCGLDYACIVRRAGVQAAGLTDTSDYAFENPRLAPAVAELRRADIEAVKLSLSREPSVRDLVAGCGPFPSGYDYTRALELWKRGRNELAAISLP